MIPGASALQSAWEGQGWVSYLQLLSHLGHALCRGGACSTALHVLVSGLLCTPMQVATTATVSAACLEALRMMLAVLEEPGGRIINPVRLTLTELMQASKVLLPVALPAAIAGAARAA